jgi:hypothetical protein
MAVDVDVAVAPSVEKPEGPAVGEGHDVKK